MISGHSAHRYAPASPTLLGSFRMSVCASVPTSPRVGGQQETKSLYAGDITRPGTNAELHAVDERIVGKEHACWVLLKRPVFRGD